jgi:hypothetical protein
MVLFSRGVSRRSDLFKDREHRQVHGNQNRGDNAANQNDHGGLKHGGERLDRRFNFIFVEISNL